MLYRFPARKIDFILHLSRLLNCFCFVLKTAKLLNSTMRIIFFLVSIFAPENILRLSLSFWQTLYTGISMKYKSGVENSQSRSVFISQKSPYSEKFFLRHDCKLSIFALRILRSNSLNLFWKYSISHPIAISVEKYT